MSIKGGAQCPTKGCLYEVMKGRPHCRQCYERLAYLSLQRMVGEEVLQAEEQRLAMMDDEDFDPYEWILIESINKADDS